MVKSVRIESSTLERLILTVTTTEDPSGALPEFSLTEVNATSPEDNPDLWSDGAWYGAWDAARGKIQAITAQIGRSPAPLELVDPTKTYRLWIRWTAGTDQPVRDLGRIYVE